LGETTETEIADNIFCELKGSREGWYGPGRILNAHVYMDNRTQAGFIHHNLIAGEDLDKVVFLNAAGKDHRVEDNILLNKGRGVVELSAYQSSTIKDSSGFDLKNNLLINFANLSDDHGHIYLLRGEGDHTFYSASENLSYNYGDSLHSTYFDVTSGAVVKFDLAGMQTLSQELGSLNYPLLYKPCQDYQTVVDPIYDYSHLPNGEESFLEHGVGTMSKTSFSDYLELKVLAGTNGSLLLPKFAVSSDPNDEYEVHMMYEKESFSLGSFFMAMTKFFPTGTSYQRVWGRTDPQGILSFSKFLKPDPNQTDFRPWINFENASSNQDYVLKLYKVRTSRYSQVCQRDWKEDFVLLRNSTSDPQMFDLGQDVYKDKQLNVVQSEIEIPPYTTELLFKSSVSSQEIPF
jgi:hypothetical protein